MFRVDLHTHSQASPDGSLRAKDYKHMLASNTLDYIAITDHNRIDFATALQAELGDRIIVGEEIAAKEGEIIGLYLQQTVPAGLSAHETVKQIHAQGGLVYIPHPFETHRKGISLNVLDSVTEQVDIVETYNGRTLQNRGKMAERWTIDHVVPGAASSDAHGKRGWGNTCSNIAEPPTRETLAMLLRDASYSTRSTGVVGRLYPKLNRLRKLP